MNSLGAWIDQLKAWLEIPLLRLGGTTITFWTLVYFLLLLFLLFYFASKLRQWLVERVLVRTKLDLGARQAIGSITRYLTLLIGLLIVLQTVGIDLTTLNVLAGAVGIGVGFGLQNIASNFISGLIILLERPIKVGDRIEVGDVDGDVLEIGARSTTVRTNDNIAIIVPNSKFITDNVTNWKYTGPRVRFRVPVGVAYGTEAREVERLLLEVAKENADVMADPPPQVRFRGFGESSLEFELLVWNTSLVHRKGKLKSDLNYAIYAKLTEYGIEIPFPQRDLHVRSGTLELKNGLPLMPTHASEPTDTET